MTNPGKRQLRIAKLRERIAGPQDAYEICRIYPCRHRTTADRGEGLNRLYCRKHIEFHRRHGSYVKRSYSAAELRPHRIQARAWVAAHYEQPALRSALAGVRRLYAIAGAPTEAYRLTGKSPAERAKVTWAYLRLREVDPLDVVSAWLAVDQCLRADLQPDWREEYRLVQVAKLIHRMAGGTHKRWERERADGSLEVTRMDQYPISRGRVLRIVGKQLSSVCEGLADLRGQ